MAPRAAAALCALATLAAAPALADFADEEPANYDKTNERYELQTSTPEFQALLGEQNARAFAFGRQSLRPVRPARCAGAVRVPRRLDLSRAKRRLRVRLRVSDRTRARAGVRRRGGRGRSGRRLRAFKPGRRTLVVRLRRRALPGRHRLTLRLRCTTGVQTTRANVRVTR